MKLKLAKFTLFWSLMFLAYHGNFVWALDVIFPVIRQYPSGYYGTGYYSKRLSPRADGLVGPTDAMRWDRFMSHELGVQFPFFPIPYPWDYGRDLTFNFPDFNANDWP